MSDSTERMHTVLVRLPNWVGDVCMALPTLWALHQAGWNPVAYGRGWAPNLLAACPWPTHAIPRGIRAGAAALRQSGCKRGILLTNSLSSALAARLAGIQATGYVGHGRSLALSQRIRKQSGRHEVIHFHTLAAAFAQQHAPQRSLEPPGHRRLPLHQAAEQAAHSALAHAEITDPYLVIAPLAAGTINGRSKIFPRWPALSQRLAAAGHRLVACPGPGEVQACREAIPDATILRDLDLASYAAICRGATAVIANDSGPMHIAAAVGAPVLGIFGVGDPQRTAPWGGEWIGSADAWPDDHLIDAAIARLGDGQAIEG